MHAKYLGSGNVSMKPYMKIGGNYRNMSGHALMGRPAARLETMGFVDKLLCCSRCLNKRQVLYLYWAIY